MNNDENNFTLYGAPYDPDAHSNEDVSKYARPTNPYGNSDTSQNTSAYSQMSRNTYGQSAYSQTSQNTYGQSAYSQTSQDTYGQSAYSQTSQDAYGQSAYNTYTYSQPEPESAKPETKSKKESRHIGRKIAIGAACAFLVGVIAGGAFLGVSYAGFQFIPGLSANNNTGSTDNADTGNATTTGNVTTVTNVELSTTVMDVSDMVESVITSVVAVEGTYTYTYGYGYFNSQSYSADVSGSGIIISVDDDEMLIVTNAHVVEDMDDGTLKVVFYDGSEAAATVKATKSSSDLAVISVALSDIPSDAIYTIATLGDSTEVEVGEAAIAIGNSMGYGISVTTGVISALNRTVTVDDVVYDNLIQTDAAINPGNSGGALFNAKGEVIGINSVKMTNTSVEGMGYAISISSAMDIIEELSQDQLSEDERGYLGINGVTITSDISSTYGYPEGVLIRTVSDNSAAEAAGIEKNDILVSFDGEKIASYDELLSRMNYYEVGAVVEVEFYRLNGKGEFELHTVEVTLTEKPE